MNLNKIPDAETVARREKMKQIYKNMSPEAKDVFHTYVVLCKRVMPHVKIVWAL